MKVLLSSQESVKQESPSISLGDWGMSVNESLQHLHTAILYAIMAVPVGLTILGAVNSNSN